MTDTQDWLRATLPRVSASGAACAPGILQPRAFLAGRSWGDFSFRAGSAAKSRLRAARDDLAEVHGAKIEHLLIPRMAFAHNIVSVPPVEGLGDEAHVLDEVGDGVALAVARSAVVIANADCPVGIAYGRAGAVVMHLGLACLWRPDVGKLLLQQAVDHLVGSGENTIGFWVGFGIRPCCFGYDHEVQSNRERAAGLVAAGLGKHVGRQVAKGPRRGQIAYDLVGMATELFRRAASKFSGLRTLVSADYRCTSCLGAKEPGGPGRYFSNVRDATGAKERNAALVWLEAHRGR